MRNVFITFSGSLQVKNRVQLFNSGRKTYRLSLYFQQVRLRFLVLLLSNDRCPADLCPGQLDVVIVMHKELRFVIRCSHL